MAMALFDAVKATRMATSKKIQPHVRIQNETENFSGVDVHAVRVYVHVNEMFDESMSSETLHHYYIRLKP